MLDEIVNKKFLMIEKVSKNNLKNFVTFYANLTHATRLVIDLYGLSDNEDEIIESINMLNTVYSETRLIILGDKEENKDLLRRIFEKEVYNIVTETSEVELEKCLLKGKTKDDVSEFFVERPVLSSLEKRKEFVQKVQAEDEQQHHETELKIQHEREEMTKKQEILLPDKSFRKHRLFITIAVCGAENHVGATHQALLISTFLNNIGFKACYLEASSVQKIFFLKSMYSVNVNERKNLIQYGGNDIYSGFKISEVMEMSYDFYIFDLGVIDDENVSSFLTKDIKIIVGGTKAWEMANLSNIFNLIGRKNIVYFILNFVVQKEELKIKNFMGKFIKTTYFSEFEPFPFAKNVNLNIFKEIFKDYLLKEETPTKPAQQKKNFISGLNLIKRK